jgi:hypothetical protein
LDITNEKFSHPNGENSDSTGEGVIIVSLDNKPYPFTKWSSSDKHHEVKIALSEEDLSDYDYGRFAFQLAHELFHVYTGNHRTNNLIETLACAFSLEILSELSAQSTTSHSPTLPYDKKWAKNFQKYRANTEKKAYAEIAKYLNLRPEGMSKSDWKNIIQNNQHFADSYPNHPFVQQMRVINSIFFLEGEVHWDLLRGLANRGLVSFPPRAFLGFVDFTDDDTKIFPEKAKEQLGRFRTEFSANLLVSPQKKTQAISAPSIAP